MSQLVQTSAAPITGPQLDNRRILAGVLDMLLQVPVAVVLIAALGAESSSLPVIVGAWSLFYYFALESGDGQTIGKRVMKLRVVRSDGGELDMGRVAVRTLLRPIDAVGAYLLGLIVMLATGQRRQRIGDLAAGTVVVDAGTVPAVAAAVEAPPAPEVEAPSQDEPAVKTAPDVGSALPSDETPEFSVPVVTDFDPFEGVPVEAEDAPEVEAEAEVEPEPPEAAPEPVSLTGPLPSAPSSEPVAEEPIAEVVEEPVAAMPDVAEPAERPQLEIISSAIDMIMADDEPEAPQASNEPEGEEPSEPSPA